MVLPTTDESAPTLSAALRSIGPVGGADLVTVPALDSLAGPAYLSVVTALDAVTAQAHGIALLDPPAAVVAQVQQDPAHDPAPLVAVAGQARSALANPSTAVMYSSSLTDTATGASVPASAAMAGAIATTDEQVGVWGQPAGLGHP